MWESDSGDDNNRPEAAIKVSGLDEGEWKDKEGLSPDEYVSSSDEPDEALQAALEIIKRSKKTIKSKRRPSMAVEDISSGAEENKKRKQNNNSQCRAPPSASRNGKQTKKKAKENVGKDDKNKVKKWSNEETAHLIDMLEERTCLWDVFDKSYHDKDKRAKALTEMEEEIGISVANIKNKILILRSQLGREMTKIAKTKSGQGADELYKPTWIFWDRLQFLCPVMQPGKSKDSWSRVNDEQISSNGAADESSSSAEFDIVQKNQQKVISSTPKVKKMSLESRRQDLLEACINVMKEPTPSASQQQCNFSLYVAEKLSQFDKRTRSIAEKRIMDILFEYELGGGVNNGGFQLMASHNNYQGYTAMLQGNDF